MRQFKRGLTEPAAVIDVKDFLSQEVGRRIIEHPQMHVCIRDNYINVYLNGCSMLKYSPLATTNKFMIHYKYLELPDSGRKDPYIPLQNIGNDLVTKRKSFIQDVLLKPSDGLKKYIAGTKKDGSLGEKGLLAKYLATATPKPFLLDLEVAFTRKLTDEEKTERENSDKAVRDTVADRIDLAVLEKENGKIFLRLVEVKVDCDSRLKSEEEGKQEILEQMRIYKDELLGSQYDDIQRSYVTVAKNYQELGIASKLGCNHDEVLEEFINNGVTDINPYLLIIRTKDKDRFMKGRNGICHYERLQKQFETLYPLPRIWSPTEN